MNSSVFIGFILGGRELSIKELSVMVTKSIVSKFGFLEKIASLLPKVSSDSTGFVSRRNLETAALSDLHHWLLAQCNNDYARRYLEGGLRHWSRKWEYPYILGQVAKFVIAGGGGYTYFRQRVRCQCDRLSARERRLGSDGY